MAVPVAPTETVSVRGAEVSAAGSAAVTVNVTGVTVGRVPVTVTVFVGGSRVPVAVAVIVPVKTAVEEGIGEKVGCKVEVPGGWEVNALTGVRDGTLVAV